MNHCIYPLRIFHTDTSVSRSSRLSVWLLSLLLLYSFPKPTIIRSAAIPLGAWKLMNLLCVIMGERPQGTALCKAKVTPKAAAISMWAKSGVHVSLLSQTHCSYDSGLYRGLYTSVYWKRSIDDLFDSWSKTHALSCSNMCADDSTLPLYWIRGNSTAIADMISVILKP